MADPQTANVQLAVPTRGSDVGTWDVPVNGNMTILDGCVGGILTLALSSAPVSLSSAQYIFKQIIFTGALNAGVTVTFPSSFIKSYEIVNSTTNSSNAVTLAVSGGTQVICCPPGEAFDCYNDGVNFKYKNLGRIGTYWDYCGSSVPNWVSGCTVPPYLNCDGTTFSSGTYPVLNTILGSTTLPDSRGRTRIALDQGGTTRITGITNAVGAAGGDQALQAHTHANTLIDLGHTHTQGLQAGTGGAVNIGGTGSGGTATNTGNNNSTPMSISNASAGSGAGQNVQPSYRGGLMLIRAG